MIAPAFTILLLGSTTIPAVVVAHALMTTVLYLELVPSQVIMNSNVSVDLTHGRGLVKVKATVVSTLNTHNGDPRQQSTQQKVKFSSPSSWIDQGRRLKKSRAMVTDALLQIKVGDRSRIVVWV